MVAQNGEIIKIDEHLTLEQLQIDDAETLFGLVEENRAYLSEFLPWVASTKKVSDLREFIERMLRRRSDNEEYGYGIKYNGNIVGHASLMHLKDGKTPEIGYWVVAEYAGRGIATAVAAALTHFAFLDLSIPRVVIRADPKNIGSNKVAEKVGYTLEGQQAEDGELTNIWGITQQSR